MHHQTLTAALLVTVSATLVLPGCASAPASNDQAALATPPTDFTLAFSVLTPPSRRNIWTLPREQRPSRFVIETDWVLRGFSGTRLADESFPRETRQLNHEQISAIWSDLAAADLLNPAHPAIVGSPPVLPIPSVPPAPTANFEALWVVTITADGDRRMLILRPDERAAAEPLLNRLSDLAWLPK